MSRTLHERRLRRILHVVCTRWKLPCEGAQTSRAWFGVSRTWPLHHRVTGTTCIGRRAPSPCRPYHRPTLLDIIDVGILISAGLLLRLRRNSSPSIGNSGHQLHGETIGCGQFRSAFFMPIRNPTGSSPRPKSWTQTSILCWIG